MAIPAVITTLATDLLVNGVAVASLIAVARFFVYGVLFVGTPLEPFRGPENDEPEEWKPSSDWYVLPALDKREVVEPSWERGIDIEDAANDDFTSEEIESGEFAER
ncbi:MAG: hypothetical protein Q8S20_01720 [Sulfuritalea sp.]|nr:hypothetical protein [Sulfuritalea sp.]